MQDKKNLLIVILTCAVMWLGVDLWLKPYQSKSDTPSIGTAITPGSDGPERSSRGVLTGAFDGSSGISDSPSDAMIVFHNEKISGFLDLRGAVVRNCILKDYKKTTDADSPPVEMLSENGKGYGACFGWAKPTGQQMDLPDSQTLWKASHAELTPEQSTTLSWSNTDGVSFFIDLSIDDQYVISIKQRVENNSDHSVDPGAPMSALIRQGPVETSGYMMLHEGAIGMADGKLQEKTYKDLGKAGQGPWMHFTGPKYDETNSSSGWLGITDKYWLAALIPNSHCNGRFVAKGLNVNTPALYKVEIQDNDSGTIQPGSSKTYEPSRLFLGPKKVSLLEDYEKKLHIDHFDMAVDFGWFYFITKPMFILLSSLQKMVGNFVLAILIMTIAIKIVFFPLSARSFRAMSRMRLLQPQIQALKSRFGDDKVRLNQSMMDLYKREKINPVSGCLPMIVQIPILFALYKVLFISIELRHASFFGWISDLSAPDPTSLFSGFGLLPWTLPAWLHIGIWPILMGVTMVVQQMMNSSSITDSQQKIMLTYVMPILFTGMMAQFPVGLVIYWTWSNFLTIAQQWFMMRYHQSV